MKRSCALCVVIAIGVVCLASSSLQAAVFRVVKLGTPFEESVFNRKSAVWNVNNKGQITGTGSGEVGGFFVHAGFVLTPQNGQWFIDADSNGSNDLMDTIVITDSRITKITPSAINNSGAVVGIAHTADASVNSGFLWENGVFTVFDSVFDTVINVVIDTVDNTTFDTLLDTVVNSYRVINLMDINSLGEITGLATNGISSNPFIKGEDSILFLPRPSNSTSGVALDMNDVGEAVGFFIIDGIRRAILWDESGVNVLNDLGSNFAEAWAINNSHQITGRMGPLTTELAAVLWDGAVPTILTGPDSTGVGIEINSRGQIVGTRARSGGGSNSFLWLPLPADGLQAGFHSLNDIIPPDPSMRLTNVRAINDNGLMLGTASFFNRPAEAILLLPPIPPGFVVNSVGDEPDSNPGDGSCSTASGDCTMRAAIEEANAHAGRDTILFNIPASGIPVIQVGSSLPEITEQIIIDGSTQPSADKVEINGSAALSADGLMISAGNSEIRHLLINNFAGNGLVLLTGGSNKIGNLSIGVGPDGTEDRGNDGHGIIIINSSNNKIGDPVLSRSNTIAHNGQIGVFVESGTGNSIRNNIIFANSGLGIDLAPIGVTSNDEGDADGGANGLQNSPVIDSVEVDLVTTIRGSISSTGNQSYDIDIYLNDACDASGYGEGKALIQSAPIFVDASGKADFALQAVVTPSLGQYITATATDQNGNTSEFSPCVGANKLRLVDEFDFPLANKTFALFRVANDPPDFSETFIDNVTTDDAGLVDVAFPLLTEGVQIRFAKQLSSTLSPKRNATPKSALSVYLDNAKFDPTSSKMSYTEVSNTMVRSEFTKKIRMTHTTVAINLYVSIEFDASVAYHNNLKNAFRLASNYLYDVTDGQVRLDTVIISDNGVGWNVADVWIHASNLEWPRATLNGIAMSGKWDRFYMPRKFYGDSTTNRNQSVVEHPLNTATPNSYRTFIHELGHYVLGLGDEYVYNTPPVKCRTVASYGFMQNQYPGGAPNSEMSVNSMYTTGVCQNTDHWVATMSSCWKHLENTYQKTYDGIFAPIIMPDERNLPGGQTFLLGPNDNLANLDVNVGAKIVFPLTHGGPVIPSQLLKFVRKDGVTLAGNIRVDQIINSPPRRIRQGNTADNGQARFMGAASEWSYSASGVSKAFILDGARIAAPNDFSWSYGQGAIPDIEGESIVLSEVQGNLPLIPSVSLTADGIQYSLQPLSQLPSTPSLVTSIVDLIIDSTVISFDGNVYRALIPDTSASVFDLTVLATDTGFNTYFFNSIISVTDVSDSDLIGRTSGIQSDFSLSLDTTVGAVRQLILTTEYPPIRSGLEAFQIQASKVGVVQTFSQVATLSGTNSLRIRYPQGSASSNGIDEETELTLKIHRWDDAQGAWIVVGGTVDTVQNEVSAEITVLGTFALFTTDIQTGIGDDQNDGSTGAVLPKDFEVHQNFPNPFNPTTVISYSLPVKAEVTIMIYNILGQKVKYFEQGQQSAGQYSVTWDATDERGKAVASGMYFYKITAGEFSASRKMVLLK